MCNHLTHEEGQTPLILVEKEGSKRAPQVLVQKMESLFDLIIKGTFENEMVL